MKKKIITGFHAIEEILKAQKKEIAEKKQTAYAVSILYSKRGPRVKKILAIAEELKIQIKQEDEKKLNELTAYLPEQLKDHRGVVLILESDTRDFELSFDEFYSYILKKEDAFVVILDSITDPHNLGSIIRSADQFGIDGIIIPEFNSIPLNNSHAAFEVIAKTSSGAAAWIPVVKTVNLVRAADKLKKAGFWIYGADAGGTSVSEMTFPKKTALVMGNEGKGISFLLEKNCDMIISIPTCGKLDSLNVGVAAGILFYQIQKTKG